jgi:hypothetical protein
MTCRGAATLRAMRCVVDAGATGRLRAKGLPGSTSEEQAEHRQSFIPRPSRNRRQEARRCARRKDSGDGNPANENLFKESQYDHVMEVAHASISAPTGTRTYTYHGHRGAGWSSRLGTGIVCSRYIHRHNEAGMGGCFLWDSRCVCCLRMGAYGSCLWNGVYRALQLLNTSVFCLCCLCYAWVRQERS